MLLKKYSILLFLSLNITISYLVLGNETNGLLVSMLALSPIVMLFSKKNYGPTDKAMIVLVVLMFLFGYFKPGFRLISFIYSLCFVTSFICLRDSFLKGYWPLQKMQRILRYIIYAYAIVLVLQQLCILAGVTPINQLFGFSNKWKLPSLAQEPSHMAIFVFFFMYSYMLISERLFGRKYCLKDAKDEKYVWASYFWCMLSCQSTSALFYCFLPFLRFFSLKNILKYSVIMVVAATGLVSILSDTPAFHRVELFTEAFLTLDINKIDVADHSAAYRMFPLFNFLENFDILDLDLWTGHGLDFGKKTFNAFALWVSDDVSYDGEINIGGFFGYILDYGLLCFLMLCYAIKKSIGRLEEPWLVVFYICLNMFIGFNMQLFWSSTVLLTYLSIYKNKKPC